MSVERLKKEGWFDKSGRIVDLNLTDSEVYQIKRGEEVTINQDGASYIVYIRKNANLDNVTQNDLVIREL